MNIPEIAIKKNTLFNIVAYFTLIDILVFPYYTKLIMPFSLPLILFLLIFFVGIKKDLYYNLYIILCFMVLTSLLVSMFFMNEDYDIDNLKRAFQLLTTFVYFFYYKSISDKLNMNVVKYVLTGCLVFISLIAIAFVWDPTTIIDLRAKFYSAGFSQLEYTRRIFLAFRFSYIFVDPNSAAYFMSILVFFLVFYFRNNMILNFVFWLSLLIVLSTSQSNGAALSVLIGIAYYFILKKPFKHFKWYVTTITLACFFIGIYYFVVYQYQDFSINFLDILDRFSKRANPEGGHELLYLRRISIWQYHLTHEVPLIVLGKGFWFSSSGKGFAYPHSDHLRMFYSYGVIAYIAIIYFLFRKIFHIKYLFLFPAFMTFSVNTLIDEQKLLALPLIFLGIALQKDNLKNRVYCMPRGMGKRGQVLVKALGK